MATARAEVVVASDNFNRADETPFGVGGDWQQVSTGGPANADLAGNQVAGSSNGSFDAVYVWQGNGTFDDAKQFSRVKVTNAAGQVGLVLLGTSTQGLVAAWNGGTGKLYIYWYSGGGYQGQLQELSSTLQNGDFIEASLEGGVITAKINGLPVTTQPNTTTLTSGKPGFETYQSGATFDDWVAGTPGVDGGGDCKGAPDGAACDDGDLCTDEGKCSGGVCVNGDPIVCTPSDFCHGTGVCDPATGFCSNPSLECNDNNDCTADSCDPSKGCVYKPLAGSCDDGNPCTTDACNP
ncbi:MAG TPA: hypothetical protein VJ826_01260, partial [Candidatus Polarisedimenticolaceae bacterium]|nr:hypothetical protein [Candidatus Polarisedimenticolaceae bacterium]